MTYRILSRSLHGTADAAIAYLHNQWGIATRSVKIETVIHPDFNYRPTISVATKDYHTLCVDVSETAYSNALDAFVQECVAKNLPARVYVATPKDLQDSQFSYKIKRAKENGVGLIEVDENGGTLIQDAIPLSLAKVRPIEPKQFPPKYREALAKAENTFRCASPDKGCAMLFDEMEALFRQVAIKLNEKKLWMSKKKISFDYENGPWASLVELVQKNVDRNRSKCPELKAAFLSRVHGLTSYRNDSGHKPGNQAALIKRDRELRTRFETATDTLLDLINHTKPLHV